ncbi:CubicO group peptidase (beta-lactamase class C family) [Friedmanniella endophytica]|uniref:Beta-lactamase n=1 Tax=Microlunatus kandeliicorticis TaxID=1759536 RepID=A0A7W3P5S3_9ACTN|nr:serine hydrolase domain-containing protein [Microlunatus kandeliicorticis]MBA8794160.1 CubicO group peptidase (beta-lactamase class C family) [Microlunatus kandeliicorticis]
MSTPHPEATPAPPAPPPEPAAPRVRRRTLLTAVGLGAAGGLGLGAAAWPAPGRLPDRQTGDAELAGTARRVIGADRPALAVAWVTRDRTRTTVIGADADDRFEIGSISKPLTGLLFADLIARGVVAPDDRLGDRLPGVTGRLAAVTLGQLASHTSGLPRTLTTGASIGRAWWGTLTATNPHETTVADLISSAERTPLTAPPGTYSNAGFGLLGAALAATAGRPYPALLREWILGPAGMRDTLVPVSTDELTRRDLLGETASGRRSGPWLGPALTPAGGVRSDIADMARLARGALTGDLPGAAAMTPTRPFQGRARIGWAWLTSPSPVDPASLVLWHNGGTGGFSSFLGADRRSGTAVVVLSASAVDVTERGFALLADLGGRR